MTISGYSNAIVDVMLGWLKGLANWVLRLFNLAGAVSASPLLWLSKNWLKLLIFFLVLGVVLDRLIWLIRWRPYWVWFRKERVIVNDDRFFKRADLDVADDWESDLKDNWDEHDYVVASTVVKPRRRDASRGAVVKNGRRPSDGAQARGRARAARPERREGARSASAMKRRGGAASDRRADSSREAAKRQQARDNIFAAKLQRQEVSDSYEDEVFNVSNLPVFDEFNSGDRDD